jgi:hypothetical protein
MRCGLLALLLINFVQHAAADDEEKDGEFVVIW